MTISESHPEPEQGQLSEIAPPEQDQHPVVDTARAAHFISEHVVIHQPDDRVSEAAEDQGWGPAKTDTQRGLKHIRAMRAVLHQASKDKERRWNKVA